MGSHSTKDPPVKLINYISYGIYRSFEFLLKPLPMEAVCVAGGLIGTLGRLILPGRKAIVIRNLRIAYGDSLNLSEIEALCRRTFWDTGANFLAAIRANTMPPEELHQRMEIVGTEHLEKARQKKAGLILLLGHMGNWETLVQMHLIVPGLTPFGGLYRPLGNPLLDTLVKRRRQKTGTKLFSRNDGFFTPITHLKKEGTLGAFSDQNAGSAGIPVPFFGKLTSMTNLPALLHRRTGAPIMPVSMCTVTPGKWRVIIHPAIKISDAEKNNTPLTTNLCAQAFETIMSESPSDVLWMHGYWKVGRKGPLQIAGIQRVKNADLIPKAVKNFKVLIFTGSLPTDSEEVIEQIHRLKTYRKDIEITLVSEFLTSPDTDVNIKMDSTEPPHIVANQIRLYDLGMQTPLDCAIDFTHDASGEKILKLAGITPRFAMRGKNVSEITAILFKRNPKKRHLAGLLDSLGIIEKAQLIQSSKWL